MTFIIKIFNFFFPKKNVITSLPFFKKVRKNGGEIYCVGGIVRDIILKKPSKDLDILITGIPMDKLEVILSKYGKVDVVGKSFGILKFKAKGLSEEIDVAIPRSERKIGEGHKGFEVYSDYKLPIESDLYRRDFRLNSMAMSYKGQIIDPFGGLKDIENKLVSLTNPDAFSDDPLRMLRSTQFASRFDFEIETKTLKAIKENVSKIQEISGERIFIELEKIVLKGNKQKGLKLLVETGLFKEIFGKYFSGIFNYTDNAKDMPDFIYSMLKKDFSNPHEVYRDILKGDSDGVKKIQALNMTKFIPAEDYLKRMLLHKMYLKSQSSLYSPIIPEVLKPFVLEFVKRQMPRSFCDLVIDGNDLMEFGFKGKQIGEKLNDILLAIYKEEIRNVKTEILDFIANEKK